jgi:hypothetical protein
MGCYNDADEFGNYLQVLLLFITSLFHIFFANIVLTPYSLKQDV